MVSKREGFPQLAVTAALPLRGRCQQHRAQRRLLPRSSPLALGCQCHEQAPSLQSSPSRPGLDHNPGAGAASCSLPERGVHRARVCCLWRKPPSPLANEMLQSCLSKEHLHKKTLISANYQVHAAVAIRNDIKMLCYAS